MQGPNAINPISAKIFIACMQAVQGGKVDSTLFQFLAPSLLTQLNNKTKGLKQKQVSKKVPEEYKIAIKKLVSEYLSKNKKLPQSFVVRKSLQKKEKKQFFENIVSKSLQRKKKPPNGKTFLKDHKLTKEKMKNSKKSNPKLEKQKSKENFEGKKENQNLKKGFEKTFQNAKNILDAYPKNIKKERNKTSKENSKNLDKQQAIPKAKLSVKQFIKQFGKVLTKETILKSKPHHFSTNNKTILKSSNKLQKHFFQRVVEKIINTKWASSLETMNTKHSIPFSTSFVNFFWKEHKPKFPKM